MTTHREDETMPSWDDVKPGDRIDYHYPYDEFDADAGTVYVKDRLVTNVRDAKVIRAAATLDAIRRPEPQYPEVGTLCYVSEQPATRRVMWRREGGWADSERGSVRWYDTQATNRTWEPVPLVPDGHITIPRPHGHMATLLRTRAQEADQIGNRATGDILRSVADAMDAQP